jgi:hypothetical protein
MEPLVAAGLADVGKPNDTASVNAYIQSWVTILNATPAPVC